MSGISPPERFSFVQKGETHVVTPINLGDASKTYHNVDLQTIRFDKFDEIYESRVPTPNLLSIENESAPNKDIADYTVPT